jgi:hypothetical protein
MLGNELVANEFFQSLATIQEIVESAAQYRPFDLGFQRIQSIVLKI